MTKLCCLDELEARVPGLSEGKWYQFRIIAVIKAGESEPPPLKQSPPFSADTRTFPINRQGQAGSKTVRAEQNCLWQIKCHGEPPVFTSGIHFPWRDVLTRELHRHDRRNTKAATSQLLSSTTQAR